MALEDLRDLKGMAQQFPWFSGARLLQAVGERQSGQVLSDETLRTAAAHLPSRAALFDLSAKPAPAKATPLRVVRKDVAPADLEQSSITQLEEAVLTQATTPESPLATAPGEPEVPPLTQTTGNLESAPPDAPEALVLAPSAADNELNDQILNAALASAYDLTWQEQVAQAGALASRPEPVPAPAPEPLTRPVPSGARLRFSDWLVASGAEVPDSPVDTAATATPTAPPSAPSLDPGALIDRFIRQETPDIPPKPAFFTPQQAAKKSLEDTSGLVTETLARIYEKQGNTAKAIDTYRRLALKYPAKSTYFAALSKALEDKSTS